MGRVRTLVRPMARSLDEARDALDDLATEAGGQTEADLDLRPTGELVALMLEQDRTVPAAVAEASSQIEVAIDAIAEALRLGGRLIYVGAGSSGRIAALDAAECESTFSTPPGKVVSLLAGGADASPLEQEATEDDRDAGVADVSALHLRPEDVVVGVSASGRTPYALGALRAADDAGALTVAVVAVQGSELGELATHEIAAVVGPEVIAGSTRLKAGTAQKLVLNTITTVAMIRLGRTYGNLMVDVRGSNEKLRARAHRVVRLATGVPDDTVEAALTAAEGSAKVAIVSLLADVDAEIARTRLADSGGHVRLALGSR
jgi:N-acetylmuramic acid 6-phosphate etherase